MKKLRLFALVVLLLFSLSACKQSSAQNEERYEIYFATQNKSFPLEALASQTYTKQEDEQAIPSLLQQLLKGPTQEHLVAIIPKGTTLRDWKLSDGVLSVDFSGSYGRLSGIDLSLADYSVALTLCQVAGVDAVITMVEGDRVSYRDRELLQVGDVSGPLHSPQVEVAEQAPPVETENSP